MPAPIMVGVDGSAAALAAVDWAADEARRRSCDLRLVHVIEPHLYDPSLAASAASDESVPEPGEKILAEATERARAAGVTATTELVDGRIAEVLIERSAAAQSTVLGSRGLGGFTGLLLGSVSLRVAGHAAGPVVVVRAPKEAAEPAGEIVAGFDGSDESQVALEYAFEEAKLRGLRLRAIHAWPLPVGHASYGLYDDTIFDFHRKNTEESLAPWREKYPDVELTWAAPTAHPAGVLIEAAKTANLLVVGSRGWGRFGSAVLGSVGHAVLHYARCPVAVVTKRRP